MPIGGPSEIVRALILVENPPRERPSALRAVSLSAAATPDHKRFEYVHSSSVISPRIEAHSPATSSLESIHEFYFKVVHKT
jgi:hypothetical protein